MSTKKLQILEGKLKYNPATTSEDGLMSAADKSKLDSVTAGANQTVIDQALSTTSENPVQNKVITTAINELNMLVGDTPVSSQINSAKDGCIIGLSVSGQTVTYTKGDGSKGTITTQDTNTTYTDMVGATSSAAGTSGLVPAPALGEDSKYLRGDGTWQDIDAIDSDRIDMICGMVVYDAKDIKV